MNLENSQLLYKLDFLKEENKRIKNSRLFGFKALMLNKEILKELTQDKGITSNLFTTHSQQISGNQINSLTRRNRVNDTDIFTKIIDLFILENEWLNQYIEDLEVERDRALYQSFISQQLLRQTEQDQKFIISQLSERIQELNLISQAQQKNKIPGIEQNTLIQFNQLTALEDYASQLKINNDKLIRKNDILIQINGVIAKKLKNVSEYMNQQGFQSNNDVGIIDQHKIIKVQQDILCLEDSRSHGESIDLDQIQYQNKIQGRIQNQPSEIPQLNLNKAFIFQQKQLNQTEKQTNKLQKNKLSELGNDYHKKDIKEVMSLKIQIDDLTLQVNRLTKNLVETQTQLKIAIQVQQKQSYYIEELQQTNEIIIEAYKKQEKQIIALNQSIDALLSRKLRTKKQQEISNLIKKNAQQIKLQLENSDQEKILSLNLRSSKKLETWPKCNIELSDIKNEENQDSNSSGSQLLDTDEVFNQISNRNRLQKYNLDRGNQNASRYFKN